MTEPIVGRGLKACKEDSGMGGVDQGALSKLWYTLCHKSNGLLLLPCHVPTITEADILAKVVGRKRSKLSPQAALSILEMRFDKESTRRISAAAAKEQ